MHTMQNVGDLSALLVLADIKHNIYIFVSDDSLLSLLLSF